MVESEKGRYFLLEGNRQYLPEIGFGQKKQDVFFSINTMPHYLLQNLLSQKQATVYLALLRLGPATILETSKETGISRTTTYRMIDSLIKMGLIKEVIKGRKRLFFAENPQKLIDLIEIEKKAIEAEEKEIKRALPKLKELMKLSEGEPKIRIFEGKEGIREIQKDILLTKDLKSIEEFVPLDEAYRIFPPHKRDHRHYMAKRINVPERVIYSSSKGPILRPIQGPIKRQFVPVSKFPFSLEITVYGNKVALVYTKTKIKAIVLENKEVADSFRSFFDLCWQAKNGPQIEAQN